MVLETDPFGNFLGQGYDFASARDWARLGNLYLLVDGVWNGERILPEGFVKFVSNASASLGGRPEPGIWRFLLDQRRRPQPGAEGALISCRELAGRRR